MNKNYKTVDTPELYRELMQKLRDAKIIALDTETDSLDVRHGKIIGGSFTTKIGEGYYIPTLVFDPDKGELVEMFTENVSRHTMLKKAFEACKGKKIIAHNASFDLRYIKNFYGVDLLEDLWLDTILLVHTLMEEGVFSVGGGKFGLKSIAQYCQEDIGIDVEAQANEEQIRLRESIHANGGSTTRENYEIYKADLDILSEYACADTDLTLRVCKYYLARLEAEGLSKFFFEDEVMPLYKEVTIPMEELGVRVDLELLEKTREEIEKDLEKNREIVIRSLLEFKEVKQWVATTAHKHFPPKTSGRFAEKLGEMFNLPFPKKEDGSLKVVKKTKEALPDSPYKKFLLGDDSEINQLDLLKVSMELWKEKNDGQYFNVQSKKHLKEIVFKCLGVKPKTQTKKGANQFDDDFIESISKDYEWANNLRIYNRLLKIKSTYIDRFLERNDGGRYYFYYKQHGTVSGRYGSDAQQLPKPKEEGEDVPLVVHYNNLVRQFMIADEGRVFIDCDYESLEPHVFAHVSGDEGIKEIFRKDWDFYSTIAIKTENIKDVSPDKKAPNFLKKVDPVRRNKAKAYSLGIPYGMGDFALSKVLNIPQKEAKKLVQGYLSGFPKLKEWLNSSRAHLEKHGWIKNQVGRVRHLDRGWNSYRVFGEKLLDWQYRRRLVKTGQFTNEEMLEHYRNWKNARNNCLNFQIQSLAASIVNRSAIAINRELKKRGIDGRVCAQIHDQLIVDVPKDRAEEAAKLVQEKMEGMTDELGLTLQLKAPPEIALNWYEGH